MTFLNPSILLGLLAAAIPLVIHLLNMKRLKKIEFSTLTFLKEIQKSKIRRVKIKQWILLIIRTLIIIFLVAAFARPTFQKISIGGAASTAKSSSVFILDNSFSMSVLGNNGSYFNQARQIIKDIIAQSVEGDEFALLFTSGSANWIQSSTSNKEVFLNKLNDTEISLTSGYLDNSLSKAAELLNRSKNFSKQIFLFTDFQKSTFKNNPITSKFNFPPDASIYTFNFASHKPVNLAVTSFVSNNQIFELNKEISFTTVVNNFSDKTVKNNVASLFINGKREAQQSITLAPYGSKQITFETTLNYTGLVDIQCELEDDDILYDNNRWLNIFVPVKTDILFLADNLSDIKYLELALTAGAEAEHVVITKRNTSQLEAMDLNKYNAVWIVGTQSIKNYSILRNFINGGGKIILMPGGNSQFENLKNTAIALGLPQPSGIVGKSGSGMQISALDNIDYNHPLFENLFEKGTAKEIESPSIYKYVRVTTQGTGKSIIELNDRSSFMGEYNIGKGKVLLFNIAPTLEWSNIPLKGIFSPLVNKAVHYLASTTRTDNNYITGDEIFLNLSSGTARQIKVTRPDNTNEFINIESTTQDFIKYNGADIAGNYEFRIGNKLIDYASVNYNPVESNPEIFTQDEFVEYLESKNFQGNLIDVSLNENILEIIEKSRYGSELWKFLLILSLLLILIEMIIARSRKRDLTDIIKNN